MAATYDEKCDTKPTTLVDRIRTLEEGLVLLHDQLDKQRAVFDEQLVLAEGKIEALRRVVGIEFNPKTVPMAQSGTLSEAAMIEQIRPRY